MNGNESSMESVENTPHTSCPSSGTSKEHARVRRTCETQTSPAIRRGPRRVMAQNIGPETGIVMTRAASRSSSSTMNGMQQSFDVCIIYSTRPSLFQVLDTVVIITNDFQRYLKGFKRMSLDDPNDCLSVDRAEYSNRDCSKARQFPPFPTTGTTSTISTVPSAESFPTRSSRSSSPPVQRRHLFSTNTGPKTKFLNTGGQISCIVYSVLCFNLLSFRFSYNFQIYTRRGWELLAIFLVFVTPSEKQSLLLTDFIDRNSERIFDRPEVAVSHFAHQCAKRLAKTHVRYKPSLNAVQEARLSRCLNILTVAKFSNSDYVNNISWKFRVPADPDQLMTTRTRLDMWVVPVVHDAHVPAGLLKLWLRQLPEPLIPHSIYQRALSACESAADVTRLVELLPNNNKLVLARLVALLQDLARDEVVVHTKMDVSNLAMVMAPNVLRCESEDPRVIFENTRREMTFLKTLIMYYDTSYIQDLKDLDIVHNAQFRYVSTRITRNVQLYK
uniref:Rho-GAP domain-containing protein n=1 Tax=Heterorhabditis bacteriophora TaxID=37862 RepID=A0A1I7WIS5_HETBA